MRIRGFKITRIVGKARGNESYRFHGSFGSRGVLVFDYDESAIKEELKGIEALEELKR